MLQEKLEKLTKSKAELSSPTKKAGTGMKNVSF
jgi:hypothetical protein